MSTIFKIITTAVIGILAFHIIMYTGMGIGELVDGTRDYSISEESLLYSLEYGQYGNLVKYYHRNIACNAKSTETMEECYAIARYYEAAIDYKIALLDNDTGLLEKTENIMVESVKEMGDLSYAKEEIDQLLGL